MSHKLIEKEVFIKAPWGRIAAMTWGDPSNRPVLLCHGKQDVCTGFRPLVNLLPTCFFYVSFDLPGNGKSDRFPEKSRFTVVDYVPTVSVVKKHFKWDQFAYIGHSMAILIGKYYNIAYPDHISRMVEIDPVPVTWTPSAFGDWYRQYYGNFYSEEQFQKVNAGLETAPKYTYEKALELIMKARSLTPEAAKHVLERCLDPAGNGLFKFNYDQRQKHIPRVPLSPDHIKEMYTSVKTPTLAIIAKSTYELGHYHNITFVTNEDEWPNRNYKVKIVEGGHDVHLNNPERLSNDISKFLLDGSTSKL